MGIRDLFTSRNKVTLEEFLRRMMRPLAATHPDFCNQGFFDAISMISLEELVGMPPATIMNIVEQYDCFRNQGTPHDDALNLIDTQRRMALLAIEGDEDWLESDRSHFPPLPEYIKEVLDRETANLGGLSISHDYIRLVIQETRTFAKANPKNTLLASQQELRKQITRPKKLSVAHAAAKVLVDMITDTTEPDARSLNLKEAALAEFHRQAVYLRAFTVTVIAMRELQESEQAHFVNIFHDLIKSYHSSMPKHDFQSFCSDMSHQTNVYSGFLKKAKGSSDNLFNLIGLAFARFCHKERDKAYMNAGQSVFAKTIEISRKVLAEYKGSMLKGI